MKKILFLGAAKFQLPPILYALKQNYYVVTCDNRPENIGHTHAHKSYNVSTIDKEAILEIARKENIDGILSFGSDVSMPAVAYVAARLKLPGNSEAAVEAMVSKAKFRDFLNRSNIQPLPFMEFAHRDKENIEPYLKSQALPFIIKPVDSSGSKGVSIVRDFDGLAEKIEGAYKESISKTVIAEKYISKTGQQICGDGFVEKGRLKFVYFGDGQFYSDERYLAPWGEIFPSRHEPSLLKAAREKTNEILAGIGFERGPVKLDIFALENGEVFVNEIGPRSGGNYIPSATLYNTNIDMIAGAVESALHQDYELPMDYRQNNAFYACYMVHSKEKSGILKGIHLSERIKKHVFEYNPYVPNGTEVRRFFKGSEALANVIFKFDDYDDMLKTYETVHDEFTIELI